MENFLQADPAVRDPFDLDGPADGEMVCSDPFLNRLGLDTELPRKDGLIAEMVNNVFD